MVRLRRYYKGMENRFYNVHDIKKMLDISESKAYQIIRQLNKELSEQGYITIAGKIPKIYFEERTYSGGKQNVDIRWWWQPSR